jgi:hypothetical protein
VADLGSRGVGSATFYDCDGVGQGPIGRISGGASLLLQPPLLLLPRRWRWRGQGYGSPEPVPGQLISNFGDLARCGGWRRWGCGRSCAGVRVWRLGSSPPPAPFPHGDGGGCALLARVVLPVASNGQPGHVMGRLGQGCLWHGGHPSSLIRMEMGQG